MSDLVPIKERLSEDLEKAKTEGKTRVERIRQIIRDAFSQTLAEVKEGSGEIGSIAKGTINTAKERAGLSSETTEKIDWQQQINRAKTAYQNLDQQSTVWHNAKIVDLRQRLETSLGNLDGKLSERYGDRYQTVKARLQPLTNWYITTRTAAAETSGITAVEQIQVDADYKAAELGSSVAQREYQIKQQVKQFFQTLRAKQDHSADN